MGDEFHGSDDFDFDIEDGEDMCDGCGKIDGCCPLCCGSSYAPGSEECDFCEYSGECAEHASKL